MTRIAYLCNGKNPKCMNSPWCKYGGYSDGCDRTEDEKYALHGKCNGHPSKYPNRFVRHFDTDDWYEKN